MKPLYVISSGPSLVRAYDSLDLSYDILAWGQILRFCYDKIREPNYWSFYDPNSVCGGASIPRIKQWYEHLKDYHNYNNLEYILSKEKINTEILLFDFLTSDTIKELLEYIVSSALFNVKKGGSPDKYKSYIQLLSSVSSKFPNNIRNITATTPMKERNDVDVNLGIPNSKAWPVDKLNSCIIPLLLYLNKHTEIYLVGFDGKLPGTNVIINSYRAYLPTWNKILKSKNINLYFVLNKDKILTPKQYLGI